MSDSEIQNQLKSLPNWEFHQKSLQINLTFKNFNECMTVGYSCCSFHTFLHGQPHIIRNDCALISVKTGIEELRRIALAFPDKKTDWLTELRSN